MTKIEFINALAERLSHLPPGEVNRITSYYSEMAEDRMEDGMPEEEAVAALGSVEEAAQSAMMEMSLPALMKAKVNESKNKFESKTLWIILAAVGFPIWFPLLMSLLAVVFSLYAAVWSLIAALCAVVVSFGATGIVGLVGSVPVMISAPAAGAFLLGFSLFSIGITLFLIKPVVIIAKALVNLTVYAVRKIKGLFIHKGPVRTGERG